MTEKRWPPWGMIMNKRRLLKLADLLEADAKNKNGIKFDMGLWGQVGDLKKPLSCGTTACAMGLAALSGEFKRAGLSYKLAGRQLLIRFKGRGDSVQAAARLFDISHKDAEYLFIWSGGTGAQGERRAAERVRSFVAGKYI